MREKSETEKGKEKGIKVAAGAGRETEAGVEIEKEEEIEAMTGRTSVETEGMRKEIGAKARRVVEMRYLWRRPTS